MLEDRVILKEDAVFVVSEPDGNLPRGNQLGLGLYRDDTRYLSVFELLVNGRAPVLLNTGIDRAYVATFQLVNPALGSGPQAVPRQSVSIRRTRFVHAGALHERIGLQNCNARPVEIELQLRFDADFLDIFAVRGYHPRAKGTVLPVDSIETGFRFAYDGADGIRRETEVNFDPAPPRREGGVAIYPLRLDPKETCVILVDILPLAGGEAPPPDFEFDRSIRDLERTYGNWNQGCTAYQTDNEVLDNGILWRSQEDLRILCDDLPTGLFPTAGTPWYAVPFGRDALVTAIQTLALNPDLAYGTLRFLAKHQGTRVDPYREEEPGKIFHELRSGELASLGEIPHTPYYGTVDATPLFLCLLVELIDWTGDLELLAEFSGNVVAALEWIDRYGDIDEDGLVEYTQRSTLGVRNQGWKDSSDSLTGRDGRPAPLPAALVEVQGYVYQAKAGLARHFARAGSAGVAARLHREAEHLRSRFEELFWVPERAYYAQALDRDKRQVISVTSNPGHCLWSGIIAPERAGAVVDRLVGEEMYSGWGIRTLAASEPAYNPMSYHNGSVWPHDNSIIAAGMRRYGRRREAELVARSVLEACMRFKDDRLPELYCGFTRDRRFGSSPGEYLLTCSPQAWAAGALFHMLQVLCGIDVDVWQRRLRIDPLPTPLFDRLRVERMRVADGYLSFEVDATAGGNPRIRVDQAPAGLELEVPA